MTDLASLRAMHNPEHIHVQMWRTALAVASLGCGVAAAAVLWPVVSGGGATLADFAVVGLLFLLTTWTALWFWVTLAGFFLVMFAARKPVAAEPHFATDRGRSSGSEYGARTAILMPIYNEDPPVVFAGLRAMADSLAATGRAEEFDFFLLSDTTNPDIWLDEERHWREMRRDAPAGINVYYRHRKQNIKRKAGNIADFCQKWGNAYKYMVVLDADSLVEGGLLVEMVDRMEKNGRLGILQSPPLPLGQASLLSRSQQFMARLCSPLLARGFAWFASKEGNYWGHNAIIRTDAFLRYCGLPDLPGERPLGGEILSHDFVEAALMRRAGYEVQLAPELVGSYEQSPTTLAEFAQRDHRWSQGNLQHSRLVVSRDIPFANRFHFAAGVMAYTAAPLWLMFLIASPLAFMTPEGLATYYAKPGVAFALFAVVMLMLLMPRLLSYLVVVSHPRERRGFGGAGQLAVSVVFEFVLSVLMAPIMMAFHSLFVFSTLRGRKVEWNSQNRTGAGLTWSAAWSIHWWQVLAGVGAAAVAYWISPTLLLWLSPIVAGLVLAVPFSVFMSSSACGEAMQRWGLMQVPEEVHPPEIVARYRTQLAALAAAPRPREPLIAALLQDALWVSDHIVNLEATDSASRAPEEVLDRAMECVAGDYYTQLIAGDKRAVLRDPEALRQLHFVAWSHVRDEFSRTPVASSGKTRGLPPGAIPTAPAPTSIPAHAR